MLPIDKLPTAPHPISLVTFGVLKTGAPFTQQGDTPMFKSFKSLLGLSLLAFFAVWMGCSSDSSPVAPYSASKTHDTSQTDPVTGAPATDTHIVDFGDNNLKYEVALEVIEPATRVPEGRHWNAFYYGSRNARTRNAFRWRQRDYEFARS